MIPWKLVVSNRCERGTIVIEVAGKAAAKTKLLIYYSGKVKLKEAKKPAQDEKASDGKGAGKQVGVQVDGEAQVAVGVVELCHLSQQFGHDWVKKKQLLRSSAWKQLEVEVLISRVKEVCLPRSFPMAGYLWHQTHAELCNATPVCFYEAGQEVNIKQWAWLLIKNN